MLWGTWSLLVHVESTIFDGHVVEFRNLQLAASAESGYVLRRLNSRNSLICHPSLHAPSLGKCGGVSGMVSGEGVGRGLRGRDTAWMDVSLHGVIRSVPACCSPRIQGLPEFSDCSYARWSISSRSRPERGLELRGGGNKVVEEGFSVQGMLGKSLLFLSTMSRRGPVGARGFPRSRKSREGVLYRGSLLGLLLSPQCYLGQAVTFG